MSIRFRCSMCGQKLRVGEDKAGQSAKCPRCQSVVTAPERVPDSAEHPIPPPPPASGPASASVQSTLQPLEELLAGLTRSRDPVNEQLPEIVIHDDSEVGTSALEPRSPPRRLHSDRIPTRTVIDYDKVAVPRRVLYLQGILLGVVSLVSFVLGMLVRAPPLPRDTAKNQTSPCTLSGEVTYGEEAPLPDDGCVVIVLPVDRRPALDERVAVDGLRPGDPLPLDQNISLRTLRGLGGDCGRTNERGQFQIRLPDRGRYHVLVISRRAARSETSRIEMADVAQIGQYFKSVVDLLEDRKYQWRTMTIRSDESLDVAF